MGLADETIPTSLDLNGNAATPQSREYSGASQDSNGPGIIHPLWESSGHLSYEGRSRRVRYFGPTTNFHWYSGNANADPGFTAPDTNRRVQRILRDISPELHDYLMDLYWTCYNDVLHVIDKHAFDKDMEKGESRYYSGFLHMCVLGIGYRFGDQSKPGMKEVNMGNRESTLHRGAKYLFESELETPGGLTTIQACLLLGDLECGMGRDKAGWMYTGTCVEPSCLDAIEALSSTSS